MKATFGEPVNQHTTLPDIPQLLFPLTFPLLSPLLVQQLFDSISTCYQTSFTSQWEILQAHYAGSTLLMLFEVYVFPVRKHPSH